MSLAQDLKGFVAMESSPISSSSDEDEEHKAALRSVAIDSKAVFEFAAPAVLTRSLTKRLSNKGYDEKDDDDKNGVDLKFYQIRVQDLLHKHLDKVLEASPVLEFEDGIEVRNRPAENDAHDAEIRLFSSAPLGVSLKRSRPTICSGTKVRVLPLRYYNSDEDASERDSRLRAAAVEGLEIREQADRMQETARARFIAAERASQLEATKEADRVRKLRQKRGEEWLPSVTKQMSREVRIENERLKAMTAKGRIGVVENYRT